LLHPAAAWAQTPPLGIDAGSGVRPVAIERAAGNAFFSLAELQPFGAQVESDPRGARVKLFGQTLSFEYGSPFFKAGKDVFQLIAPAQKDARVSTQLLTEWLPKRFPEKLAFKNGTLRAKLTPAQAQALAREASRAPAPSPAPAQAPAQNRRTSTERRRTREKYARGRDRCGPRRQGSRQGRTERAG
jgi:hypothetical protein